MIRYASSFHTFSFLIAAGLFAALPAAKAADQKLSAAAASQIGALMAEKGSRTPAQQKMDSQLVYFSKARQKNSILAQAPALESYVKEDEAGRVLLDIRATVSPALLNAITTAGGEIVREVPAYGAVRAYVPANLVEIIAARSDVRFIEPAVEFTTNLGSVASDADRTHRTNTARSTFGVDGTGIKIGVLSDGISSLALSKANGNLNSKATFLTGLAGSGDEGTAMMELIQDMLPGAELIFSTALGGNAAFASNILALQAAGCSVIVDDITYLNESPFQDAVISQAVNTVSAAGVMYFSSARNSGNKNDGTSGTWEGDFADGGAAAAPITTSGTLLDFGGGVTYNTVGTGGSSRRVDLFWADPLGGSTNDYDLFVLDSTGTSVLRSSTNIQNGTQDPYEATSTLNIGERIVIVKKAGAANRFIHLDTGRATLAISTDGNVRGHNAAVSANAFSVSATPVYTSPSPGYFVGGATNPVETFTSDGPRRMFFQPNGTPYTAGNFSATDGQVFNKPDITAADGSATSVSGFTFFYGTSAAAPHAAAIAAMLRCYNPALTPAQIRTLMTSTALDIEAPGYDRDSGAGIVMGLQAMQAAPVPDALTITTGGLSATGAIGGPFDPTSATYTLTNNGASNLTWLAVRIESWNSVTPANGFLAPGESTVVTCSLTFAANSLATGGHSDTISIMNATSGFIRRYTANLYIQDYVMSTVWSSYGGGANGIANSPRTFMGQAFTLGGAAGTSNIPLSKGIAYLISPVGGGATYENIRLTVTLWGTASGSTTGTTPAFSNKIGSYDYDLGPMDIVSTTIYPIRFNLPSTVVMPSQTGGITFSFQGDTGNGLTPRENLIPLAHIQSPPTVGTPAAGTSPTFGWYQNISGENDGNFLGSSLRFFNGQIANCMSFVLQAGKGPAMTVRGNGIGIFNGSNRSSTARGTDFGTTSVTGGSVIRTFTIHNSGNAALILDPLRVRVSGVNAADFTVTRQPTTPIAAKEGSSSFQITFNPSAAGLRAASVDVYSNDTANSPYTFAIRGTGTNTGPIITSLLTASGAIGTSFSYQVTASGTPTSYSASNLPAGLSINTETGSISGNPPVAGTFHVFVTATNEEGTGSATLALTINYTTPVVLFDSHTDAAITNTTSTPHTYMGTSYILDTAGGTSNITITGGKAYLSALTVASYANVRLKIYLWGAATNATSGTTAVFSNLLTTHSVDLGPLSTVFGGVYPYTFTLPSPVTLPSQTGGITFSWEGDIGAGLILTENLCTAIRSSSTPSMATGSTSLGAPGVNGYYRNASNESNGNFFGNSYRSVAGLTYQSLALQLYGSQAPPMAVTGDATPFVNSATVNATVNPAGAATTAYIEYGITSNYGSTAAITLNPNNGTTAQNLAVAISGLTANTTYHYRVVALNNFGMTEGRNMTLTTYDQNRPLAVTSTATNSTYQEGYNIPITIAFVSPVTVTGAPLLQLNSGASVFANYTGGNGTRTLTFNYLTAAGHDSPDLDYVSTSALKTNGGSITDADGAASLVLPPPGSAGSLGFNKALVVDAISPAVAVTPTGTTLTTFPIVFTLTFSEPVTGLTSSSITVTNGAKGTLSGSGSVYTLNVTPISNGTVTCTVAGNAAKDAAQNSSLVSNTASVTYSAAPTVNVTTAGSYTNFSPITFTMTFSQSVTGLTTAGITVNNGTKSSIFGSGSVYTIFIYPTGQGVVTLQVSAGAAKNASNVGNVASNNAIVTYDNIPPTLAITGPGASARSSPIFFTFTFSENVGNFSASVIGVTNATKGTFSGSGSVYTLSVTPTSQALVTCSVNSGAVKDPSNNATTSASSASVLYDSVVPTATVQPLGPLNTSPLTFVLSFSEPVTGLTAAGITVTNGTKGALEGSGTAYTLSVTPTAEGPVSCRINALAAQDGAGNPSTVSNTVTVDYDLTPPTAVISAGPSPTKNSPITFTLTFSETVYSLTQSKIEVGNGTKGTLTAVNGRTYTLPVTPSAQGPVTCQVPAGAAHDNALNYNLISEIKSVTYDSEPPTLLSAHLASENPDETLAKVADLLNLSFTSNEAIKPPTVVLGGLTASVINTGGNNWIATAPVNTNTPEGPVAFSIAFADVADNAGVTVTTTSDASTVIADLTAPGILTASIAAVNVVKKSAKAGDSLSLTFTTNERVKMPVVTIAGVSATVTHLDENNWLATAVLPQDAADGNVNLSVTLTDIAGNIAPPITSTTDGSAVKADLTPPQLVSVHIASNSAVTTLAKAGDIVTLSFTANEPIQGPIVTIAGAIRTAVSGEGNAWTATAIIAESDAEGSTTLSVAFTDAVGNAATNITSTSDASSVRIDLTPPILTAVHLQSSNTKPLYAKVGDTLTLILTANEAIQQPVVTLAGQQAALQNTSGNQWTVERLLTAPLPQGDAAVSVAFQDQAGNAGTSVTQTTDASAIAIDTEAPGFASQPINRTINPGATTSFSVTASSLSPVIYQWRKDTMDIEGATESTLTIAGATQDDEASYDCVVTNIVSSSTSEAALLSINDPITFTVHPADTAVNQGAAVELTVAVTGTQPISYVWRKDGTAIPGTNAATLQIANGQAAHAGYYDVIATNIVGEQTSNKGYLSVLAGAPRITRHPASRMIQPEASVTFSVGAVGAAPFTYEWRKNGAKIANSNSPSFTIATVTATDAAGYSVKITNSAGTVTSDTATLLVKPFSYIFSTLAGSSGASGFADGTIEARFFRPNHLVRDSAGNLFITDRTNFTIRKVTPSGTVTTFAGTAGSSGVKDGPGAVASFTDIEGIGIDGEDNLYVADSTVGTIRRITPTGIVSTFAGRYLSPATSTDGIGTAATFNEPRGIAVTAEGVVYVSERSHVIRKILPDGTVSTFAGTAGTSGAVDGLGTAALFNRPSGLAVDSSGNVYVADESNHTLRKITPAGQVTTVAGSAGSAGKTDGKGTAAKFSTPAGVAVDDNGVLYVTDAGNHTLRAISVAGVVTTLGGLAGTPGSEDGMGSRARFRSLRGVFVDSDGVLYIADTENHSIRRGVIMPLPEITRQPQSQLVGIGQPATFEVEAAGAPPLSYQWQKNTAKIPATEPTSTTASYITPRVSAASAGTYSVIVSGPAGSVTSAAARLGLVGITNSEIAINEAATLTLAAIAAGEKLTYEWRKNDQPLADDDRVSGVATAKLSITKITLDDANVYTCMIRMGDIGLSSGTFDVKVRSKPVIADFTHATWIASGTVTDKVMALDMSSLNRPTAYTISGLPAGMTFDKATGHFGGKPNVPGKYTLKITATNAAGSSAVQIINVDVLPLPDTCIGTFNGLADRNQILSAPTPGKKLRGHGGSLYNLVITRAGTFTGALQLEEKTYTFPAGSRLEAVAGEDPTASITLIRGTATDAIADLTLSFKIAQDTGELTGTVTDGLPTSPPIPVRAWQKSWSAKATAQSLANPATHLAGNYTAMWDIDSDLQGHAYHPEIPQGKGYLTMKVTTDGIITWSGQLPDGTAVTGSTTLGPAGEIPIHLFLYTPADASTAGSVHGWIYATEDSPTFPYNKGDALVDGEINWLKLEQPTSSSSRSYRDGFPLSTLMVSGGIYVPPALKTPVIGLEHRGTGIKNAELTFGEAGLMSSGLAGPGSPLGVTEGTISQRLQITQTNSVILPTGTANPAGVTLTLNAAKGLMNGKFVLKDSPAGLPKVTRNVVWSGVLIPRLQVGAGVFQLPQLPTPAKADILSGPVLLQSSR